MSKRVYSTSVKNVRIFLRLLSAFLILLMLICVDFEHALNQSQPINDEIEVTPEQLLAGVPSPRIPISLKELVEDLLNVTPGGTPDYDGDGLPDPVEAIIGTDFNDTDTDNDRISDYYEAFNDTDPLEIDSNFDGLADFFECNVSVMDIDGDSLANAWDFDNDNDGVCDDWDLSPFSRSDIHSNFQFEIRLDGKPTYITLQLRPEDSNLLKLVNQWWDWPFDDQGHMKDCDNSEKDVKVVPLLSINSSHVPDPSQLIEYGILVKSINSQTNSCEILVPLVPEWEQEDVVAFKAKMFYPNAVPYNLTMDVRFIWQVIGYTDLEAKALLASNDKYLTQLDNGRILANGSSAEIKEELQWEDMGHNKTAIKADNGFYLSVADNGTVTATSSLLNERAIFLIVRQDSDTIALQAYNGLYVSRKSNLDLVADATSIGSNEKFDEVDLGYKPAATILVTYDDNFMLTGFSVEENFDVDVGVFYSENENQTIAANMLMNYIFLANETLHLTNMPYQILLNGLENVSSTVQSFSHREQSVVAINNELLPDALDELPVNQTLPVIILNEYSSKIVDMKDLVDGEYIMSSSVVVDVINEPTLTIKHMKTNYYNTSSYDAQSLMDAIEHIQDIGLGETAEFNLISMMIQWYAGEHRVIGGGIPYTTYEPEGEVYNTIQYAAVGTLVGLDFITQTVHSLSAFHEVSKTGSYKGMRKLQFKKWFAAFQKLDDINSLGKVTKVIDDIMLVMGIFLDIGMSIGAGLMIAQSVGGHLGRVIGATYGSIMAGLALIATAVLWAVVEFVPLGWLVALAAVIVDLVLGGSDKLISWLTELIVGDFEQVNDSTPYIELGGEPRINVNDVDGNGLDVGDRFQVEVNLLNILNVTGTKAGGSAISARYLSYITIPMHIYGNVFAKGYPDEIHSTEIHNVTLILNDIEYSLPEFYSEYNPLFHNYATNARRIINSTSSAEIQFRKAMVNYPVPIILNSEYRLHYLYECNIDSTWQTVERNTSSTWMMLYYDVMPKDIHAFTRWRGITPLDSDRDGLLDTEEPADMIWKYDTDSDGLNDKYETMMGMDPREFDGDHDGLSDEWEYHFGTEWDNRDSDGDALRDYREIAGWKIDFEYEGYPFVLTVYSDPRLLDTDDDGVDDFMEYWSGLNPRSSDTNGDGTPDEAQSLPSVDVQFQSSYGSDLPSNTGFDELTIDSEDNIYIMNYDSGTPTGGWPRYAANTNWSITKLNSDLQLLPSGDHFNELEVGLQDDIHKIAFGNTSQSIFVIGFEHGISYRVDRVWSFSQNGSHLLGYFPEDNWHKHEFVFSSNGYFYALGVSDGPQLIANCTVSSWPDPPTSGTISHQLMYYDFSLEALVGPLGEFKDLAIDENNERLYVACTDRVVGIDTAGEINPFLFDGTFTNAKGVDVDEDGFVYVVDAGANQIKVFDKWGENYPLWGDSGSFGSYGFEDGNFSNPIDLAVSSSGDLYVVENWDDGARIQKFYQNRTAASDILNPDDDSDFDGLTNFNETQGWEISFTNASGTFVQNVTSCPLLKDTDLDGINDYIEWQLGSNPRNIDSDGDGLSDFDEWVIVSNPTPMVASFRKSFLLAESRFVLANGGGSSLTNFDSDGDLLGDGIEFSFGSSLIDNDTDDEGLSDLEEFLLNTDPTSNDTDFDGLDDTSEIDINTDPNAQDSDGDFLFDFMEHDLGSNPLHGDSDTDGLRDGIETFLKTSPTTNDTDGDGVPDGLEVALWLDPTSNDTDADGVLDSEELEYGTNPFSNDTDHDGIPDNLDADTTYTEIIDVVLVLESELDEDAIGFKEELEERTDLTLVSYGDFLVDYTQASHIVLVGRPNASADTVGSLIYELIEGTGSVFDDMIANDSHEMAVRHGVWTPNQTVVLLSSVRPTDIYTILSVLRSRGISILPNSAIVDYNIAPAEFIIHEIDTVKQTDSIVRIALSSPVIPTIQIRKYNESTTEYSLTHSTGLSSDQVSMGRYLDVLITSVGTSSDIVEHALIKIYYRESDLDRNENGTIDDDEDLNESTLVLYCYDDSTSTWIKLTDELDWVLEVGVNTTDFEIYGESYAGFVWARVTHLSLFAVGGVLNGYVAQDNTLLILGLGGAGIAVIGAGLLLRKRRKPKPKTLSKQKQAKKTSSKSEKRKGKK